MFKALVALGAAAVVTAGSVGVMQAAPSPNQASADRAPVSCEVRLTRTPDGVRLESWVRAQQATQGEYQLIVSKAGPAGTSDVSQGGEFRVDARGAVVLGSTEFGLERGARLKARLVLSDRHGRLCEHEAGS